MTDNKPQKLKAFLENLPDHLVQQLTQAVERDRLEGGSELPHELLLAGLRSNFSTSERHVNRTPTPMRMFCMPVEDLLVAARREKRPGRIARSSLTPVWEWLASDLMPALFRDHYDQLTTAILENDSAKIRESAAAFHEAGAAAISRALEGAPEGSERRKEIAAALGGEDVVRDADDIAKVLNAAPEIMELRQDLTPRVKTLNREILKKLCASYEALAEQKPDSAGYLIDVAMHRMSRPWEILRAAAFLTKQIDQGSISREDLDLSVNLLFGDMEDCIAYFEEQNVRTFDPDDARRYITTYARLAQGIAEELEALKDKAWQDRYDELQAAGAKEFERLIEQVPEQIKSAMPFRLVGSYASSSSRRPDLRRDPDPELLERAVKLATFMRESRPLAFAANVANVHSDAYDAILDNLNSYRNGLLTELRSFEDASMLSRARAYLDLTVELTAILVSEGEAQIFRHKSAMAERNDLAANG
jgi:hypothetical protein